MPFEAVFDEMKLLLVSVYGDDIVRQVLKVIKGWICNGVPQKGWPEQWEDIWR